MGPIRHVIAILDDEEDCRRAVARLLKAHGYDTAGFGAGEELIAETTRRAFDCLLLDLHMPGMTGFDVLAELRHRRASLPAIVITGHDDPALVTKALGLNAFECHLKPIAAPVLLGSIERAMARHPAASCPAPGR